MTTEEKHQVFDDIILMILETDIPIEKKDEQREKVKEIFAKIETDK